MKKSTIYIFSILLALAGCEGQTEYYTEIHNLSKNNITITYSNSEYGTETVSIIAPGSIDVKLQYEKLGGAGVNMDCASWAYGTLITNSNGDTCTKDLTNENHWGSITETKSKMPAAYKHTCRMIISDEDF